MLLAVPSVAYAQFFGEITGSVTTRSGDSIPGATISVYLPSGQTVTVVTGSDGSFRIPQVPPGQYTVSLTLEGYGVQSRSVTVGFGQSSSLSFTVDDREEMITVSSLPESPEKRTFDEPIWNLWTEPPSAGVSWKPVRMAPNRDYTFVVNLSAMPLREFADAAVYARRANSTFRSWLDENSDDTARVRLVVVPDRRYFNPLTPAEATGPMTIELKKARAARKKGFEVPQSAFEVLQASGTAAPFHFGTESFSLHTRGNAGSAPISISIWSDGRPIDELSAALCIVNSEDDPCVPKGSPETSLSGVDLNVSGKYPNAALHIIDQETGLVAVFRCNSCGWKRGEYKHWRIEETAESFSRSITENLNSLSPAEPPDDFVPPSDSVGTNLANILFPAGDSEADAARKTLANLIRQGRASARAGKLPPSMFVRLIPAMPALILTPLNLMRFRMADGSDEYLGAYVNVSIPLEYQSYARAGACLENWRLFVPPDPPRPSMDAVTLARSEFAGWIRTFADVCRGCVETVENDFRNWLGKQQKEKVSVVTLSHHNRENQLYFTDNAIPSIHYSAISRPFAAPSAAILAACGTGSPGASEFVRKLNQQGVDTIIATHTTVDAKMAGTFLKLLLDELSNHPRDRNYGLGQARFDAVRTLSAMTGEDGKPYGAMALGVPAGGKRRDPRLSARGRKELEMISRRDLLLTFAGSSLFTFPASAKLPNGIGLRPDFDGGLPRLTLGDKPAHPAEEKIARAVLAKAPAGPTPFDVAQYFIEVGQGTHGEDWNLTSGDGRNAGTP